MAGELSAPITRTSIQESDSWRRMAILRAEGRNLTVRQALVFTGLRCDGDTASVNATIPNE